MAQMGFFDLSDRYAKKDSLVEVNAVVQWEGSGQHWSGSGAIFRDALKPELFKKQPYYLPGCDIYPYTIRPPLSSAQSATAFP